MCSTEQYYISSILYQRCTGSDRPNPATGTWVLLDVKDEFDRLRKAHNWRMYVISSAPARMVLEVTPPSNCVVGEWILSVFTTTIGTPVQRELRYEYLNDIIVLFNPWNPGKGHSDVCN